MLLNAAEFCLLKRIFVLIHNFISRDSQLETEIMFFKLKKMLIVFLLFGSILRIKLAKKCKLKPGRRAPKVAGGLKILASLMSAGHGGFTSLLFPLKGKTSL